MTIHFGRVSQMFWFSAYKLILLGALKLSVNTYFSIVILTYQYLIDDRRSLGTLWPWSSRIDHFKNNRQKIDNLT